MALSDLGDQIMLSCGGGTVPCEIFGSILDLYPLHASSILPSLVTIQEVSRH